MFEQYMSNYQSNINLISVIKNYLRKVYIFKFVSFFVSVLSYPWKGRGAILMYHRVLPTELLKEDLNVGMAVTTTEFEKQIKTLKSKYIEIPNDFGYYTINIDNGKLPDLSDLPKKPRVRIRVSNTKPAQLKRALTQIRKVAKIQESVVTRVDGLSKDKVRDNKINIGNVNNIGYQFSLIEEYLNNNYAVDEDTMIKINKILSDLNTKIASEDIIRNINWKLKKFEFSNMFSYGEDNVVDFTKLNGIVGLFAPNASGKSALLDALAFCLFDVSTRAVRANNIINKAKTNMHCKLNFEIDGTNYFIEKKGKKNLRSGHVKVDIDFWMVDENGDTTSLNGDQRRTTQLNIRKVVGDFEDFVLTSMSSQNDSTVFINKTQKERKELLSQFMGLKIFDRLWVQASEDIKDVNALLTDFKKSDYCLSSFQVIDICNFIFVNLDDSAQHLGEQAEGFEEDLKEKVPFLDRLHALPVDKKRPSTVKANWKIVVDNYLECYHCTKAHPAFANLIDMKHYQIDVYSFWSRQYAPITNPDSNAYKFDKIKKISSSNNLQTIVIPSMRTPKRSINLAEELLGKENLVITNIDKKAYLSALAISNYLVVTCDSTSMISEAALTGKPVYIAMMKSFKTSVRFKKFYSQLRDLGITRELNNRVESWSYNSLNEVSRIAPIVKSRMKKNGII